MGSSFEAIRGVMLAIAFLAIAAALAMYLDVAELLPGIGIPFLAWFVWKRFGVSTIGVVLGVVSLELLTVAGSFMSRSDGNIFDLIPLQILMVSALVGVCASSVAFLVYACFSRVRRWRNAFGVVATPVLFILAAFAIQPIFYVSCEWRKERRWGVNSEPMRRLLRDIDVISQQLGRVPKSTEELEKLRRERMPEFRWGWHTTHSIRYRAVDARRFQLYFGYDMGEWLYDSGTPEKGWQHVD